MPRALRSPFSIDVHLHGYELLTYVADTDRVDAGVGVPAPSSTRPLDVAPVVDGRDADEAMAGALLVATEVATGADDPVALVDTGSEDAGKDPAEVAALLIARVELTALDGSWVGVDDWATDPEFAGCV